VIDVAPRAAQDHVVDEPVFVGQSTEGIRDNALAEAPIACISQAANEFGREKDRHNADCESETGVGGSSHDQGGDKDDCKASPEALLAPGEVTTPDMDDTHQ
jgi:hypothetical protein